MQCTQCVLVCTPYHHKITMSQNPKKEASSKAVVVSLVVSNPAVAVYNSYGTFHTRERNKETFFLKMTMKYKTGDRWTLNTCFLTGLNNSGCPLTARHCHAWPPPFCPLLD